MQFTVEQDRIVLEQGPSPLPSPPTYLAGQRTDKGHKEGNQASLCVKALTILWVKNTSSQSLLSVYANILILCPCYSIPSPKHPMHLKGLEGAGKTVLGQEGDLSIQEEGHHVRHTLGSQPRRDIAMCCSGGSPDSSWALARRKRVL